MLKLVFILYHNDFIKGYVIETNNGYRHEKKGTKRRLAIWNMLILACYLTVRANTWFATAVVCGGRWGGAIRAVLTPSHAQRKGLRVEILARKVSNKGFHAARRKEGKGM